MLKLGVIGLGVISHYYLASLSNNTEFQLHAVCDLDPAQFNTIDQRKVFVTTDYRCLLADPALDCVIINLPNELHYEACRSALLAGKHVCCEKPLTLTSADALDLSFLAKKNHLTLFTAFHRRYNQNYLNLLRQLPERDKVSKVVIEYKEKIEEHIGKDAWYLDPARCGGGCIADNGPNAFDTVVDLLGDVEVIAVKVNKYHQQIDMNVEVDLETIDKIPVKVLLDWDYPEGEAKTIQIHLRDGTVLETDMLANFPQFKSSLYHEYAAILKDFARHIQCREGAGEAGIRTVNLVTQCYQKINSTQLEALA